MFIAGQRKSAFHQVRDIALMGRWRFNPRTLFSQGEQGAWYDPSDITSMYQDSTGTTAAAINQPVGLLLDKRLGMVRGAEQITNGDFSAGVSGWVVSGNGVAGDGSLSVVNGQLNIVRNTTDAFAFRTDNDNLVANKSYELTFTLVSGDTVVGHGNLVNPLTDAAIIANVSGAGEKRYIFSHALSTNRRIVFWPSAASSTVVIDNVSVREIPGNHATQATSASRSTLIDASGYYGTDYDGVDDSDSSATGGGGTAGFFLCESLRVDGGAAAVRTIWSDAGSNGGYRARINASNQLELAAGDGSALTPPTANAPTTSTTGGTLAAATYYYVITALNALGESLKSNEVSVATTGTTSSNTVTWGAIAEATSYRVYRGTAAGAQDVYYAPGNVTSYVDTGAAATSGAPPTTTGTAYTTIATVGTLPVGETHVVTAWDDGTNLNVQIDQGAVASVARPVVSAGTAGFTEGKDNGAASSFFNGVIFARVYRKDSAPDAATRAAVQRYCASKAGKTL